VYERLYYGAAVAPSILRKSERDDAVVVAHSFSKSYCMTGWRLGWMVGRSDVVHKATEMNEFIISHAPSMVQKPAKLPCARENLKSNLWLPDCKENLEFCQSALAIDAWCYPSEARRGLLPVSPDFRPPRFL
jgi:aspartate/methionine/tyrosine aminotransferase